MSSRKERGNKVSTGLLNDWLWKIGAKKESKERDPEEQPDATHYVLRGGIIFLPDNQRDRFFELYLADIDNGYPHSISENRTKVFRLFFDLDIRRKEQPVPDEQLLTYCRKIYETVRRFYPVDTPFDRFFIIVLRPAKDSKVRKPEEHCVSWKTGLHLIFPNLYVTQGPALAIREAVVGRLRADIGDIEKQNSWEDIVDEAVYTSNGLRMPFSHKWVPCRACKGNAGRRGECVVCNGVGKYDGGRPYAPWKCLVQGNESALALAEVRSNPRRYMACMTIRSTKTEPTAGWKPYEGAPSAPGAARPEKQVRVPGEGRTPRREFVEDAQALNKSTKIVVPTCDARYGAVQRFIRRFIYPEKWGKICVHRIYTTPKEKWFRILVRGDGSSYCLNYDRDHRSNRIYFVLKPEGIVQKCFCNCDVNRKYGRCSEYVSETFEISDALQKEFWPGFSTLGPLWGVRNLTGLSHPDQRKLLAEQVRLELIHDIGDTDDENEFGHLPESSHTVANSMLKDCDIRELNLGTEHVPRVDDLPDLRGAKRKTPSGNRGRKKKSAKQKRVITEETDEQEEEEEEILSSSSEEDQRQEHESSEPETEIED